MLFEEMQARSEMGVSRISALLLENMNCFKNFCLKNALCKSPPPSERRVRVRERHSYKFPPPLGGGLRLRGYRGEHASHPPGNHERERGR